MALSRACPSRTHKWGTPFAPLSWLLPAAPEDRGHSTNRVCTEASSRVCDSEPDSGHGWLCDPSQRLPALGSAASGFCKGNCTRQNRSSLDETGGCRVTPQHLPCPGWGRATISARVLRWNPLKSMGLVARTPLGKATFFHIAA